MLGIGAFVNPVRPIEQIAPSMEGATVARGRSWARASLTFGSAGTLVAVGYIDPGNWATDLAGGSRFGYAPLSVVVLSSLAAMLFQTMSARLGIATGRDLAESTRAMSPRFAWLHWMAAELAVIATDIAEVMGAALALTLLFDIPLALGVVATGADVAVLLALDRRGSHVLDRIVASLVVIVAVAFAYELALARPSFVEMAHGLVPRAALVTNPAMLYTAVGIIGATVMPHNLYLHSHLLSSRTRLRGEAEKREIAKRATIDTVVSLSGAMLLNAALVVLAAALFRRAENEPSLEISDAHRLLPPLLGGALAPIAFAVALLAAGQSATITGTLAGQSIMTGFLRLRWPAWKRRLVTRACAIVPSLITIAIAGDAAAGKLLILSQVVLSLQLPFALVPLLRLTSDRRVMGSLASPPVMIVLGVVCALVIVAANSAMLIGMLG